MKLLRLRFACRHSLQVAYQVTDAAGRTRVLSTGLVVAVTLTATGAAKTTTSACGGPDAASGVGLCRVAAPAGWFSAAAAVPVAASVALKYGGNAAAAAATASAGTVTLTPPPVFAPLAAVGMALTLPFHPLLAGERFTVPVVANTGGQDLSVWVLAFTYDPAVLTYVGTTTAATYAAAVVTATSGSVKMSTSGLRSGVSTQTV